MNAGTATDIKKAAPGQVFAAKKLAETSNCLFYAQFRKLTHRACPIFAKRRLPWRGKGYSRDKKNATTAVSGAIAELTWRLLQSAIDLTPSALLTSRETSAQDPRPPYNDIT